VRPGFLDDLVVYFLPSHQYSPTGCGCTISVPST
jgi:hypothetical protein